MEFALNGNTLPGPVTREMIDASIRSLADEDGSFAILSTGEQRYIQTMSDASGAYVLEYRDGSEAEHYVVADTALSANKVVWAFQSYLAGNDLWRTEFQWSAHEVFTLPPPGRKTTTAIGIASLAAGLPLLALLGLGLVRAAERPPKVGIWAVLAVFGLLGLFLTNVGFRLTLNRPKSDGGLLGPFLLGLLGSMFTVGGVLLIYTTWCGTCETSISDQLAPGGFSLLFGALCFYALWKKRRDADGV